MLHCAPRPRRRLHHPRRLRLPYALPRVRLHRLRSGKLLCFAFRHILLRVTFPALRLAFPCRKVEYGLDSAKEEEPEIMEERDFFNETTEQRSHTLTCPKCGQAA